MKSGLACCLSAFSYAAQKSISPPPRRTLKLICTVDEEDFMRGSERCIQSGWVTKEDWILDAEPTNGQIQVAHKGRTWYEIRQSPGTRLMPVRHGKGQTLLPPWRRSFMRSVPRSKTRRHIRISVSLRSHLGRSRAVIVRMSFRINASCGSICALFRHFVPNRPTGSSNRRSKTHKPLYPESMLPTRSPKPPLCGKRRTFSIIKTFA